MQEVDKTSREVVYEYSSSREREREREELCVHVRFD